MNIPSYRYGTIVPYINADKSSTEIIADPPSTNGVCKGCVFQDTGRCHQASECMSLIWKEIV